MRVAIDAVTVARGGQAILDALVGDLQARGAKITVFRATPTPGRLGLMRWALREWAEQARNFDRALTFTGLATAPGQVCLVHNALYYEPASKRLSLAAQLRLAVLRELTAHAIAASRAVVVQSPTMADHVARFHGVRAHQIMTIPAPLRAERPVGGDLVWVGNELPFKDSGTAIAAAAGLTRALTLIGNSSPMPDGPWHRWLGDLPRADVFSHYAGARVLVATSEAESLGLPLVEALQVGLLVVAPNLPWARAVCGEAAAYYAPGNATGLMEAVREVEANAAWYRDHARARVAAWEQDAPMARLAELIMS